MTAQICPNCGEENPARFRLCGYCGTALAPAAPPSQVRKIVTLVFVDLKGSTNLGEQLDPEAMHEVKDRYFTAMAAEITRHGGKIEKYIGDAIMAVFGLPRAHEDDALRAVRAAAGMQSALVSLNKGLEQAYGIRLANRTGVSTGEVVANVDPGADQLLATGDAVNVTARLEQAAPENEVLIGELTYGLVRDAVDAEAVEPLTLKGKTDPVRAYRLVRVRQHVVEGRARHEDAPMVGRRKELNRLGAGFNAMSVQRAARLTTVIGDAGVGKSRLVREFVTSVADAAYVVSGRCLSYGEGITFWPLVEIVRSAAGIRDDDPPDAARSKLIALVGERDVAARVATMVGLSRGEFALPELFWGARRFLEILAARQPIVVVVDDIHWAEPTFLDLIEHLLETAEAQIFVVCTARHEFVERLPDWPSRPNADRILLEPLPAAAAAQIVENLLGEAAMPDAIKARIVAAAQGNPLFVEQILSMLVDSGALRYDDGAWIRADETSDLTIPPTIQALLAARLDQLSREERAVIESGSVIGMQFEASAVTELAPEELRANVPRHLTDLTAKRLVEPHEDAPDATYWFQHILIRDAAYQGLLKRARANLHERFVRWADRVNAVRGRELEFEEILGFHLEQAYLYLADLGPVDDAGRSLGADASRRLASAGRRAFGRGDAPAAVNLLRRATALLPALDPDRLWLLPELGEALLELGEFKSAEAVLSEAVAAADELFDDRLRHHAALVLLMVELYSGAREGWSARVAEAAERAIPLFESADDQVGLAHAWRLQFGAQSSVGHLGVAVTSAERVIEHARLAGNKRMAARGAAGYVMAALYGPTPATAAIEASETLLNEFSGDRRTEGVILGVLAELYAMDGQFARARATYERARVTLEQLGRNILAAATSANSWRVEMLAGDPAAAERELRRDYVALDRMGERNLSSALAALLGQVLLVLGDEVEAERFTEIAAATAAEDDVLSQATVRSVRAKLLARRRDARADTSIREVLDLVQSTQDVVLKSETLLDAAEVFHLLDRDVDAAQLLNDALALAEAKGNRALRARIRDLEDLVAARVERKVGPDWAARPVPAEAG